jgi:hypothetical protein
MKADVLKVAALFACVVMVNGIIATVLLLWLQSAASPETEANGILPLIGNARPAGGQRWRRSPGRGRQPALQRLLEQVIGVTNRIIADGRHLHVAMRSIEAGGLERMRANHHLPAAE